ncbi:patatin [Chelonobacter oris]|uniref:Patatin n=1 Tax=Chelonobacter oris TaxID=505317 RepID=A0A0A3AN33_9PAST|nr:patatin-like phospholipase family protein [Chelonobacter oris]KGQ70828.1 patatin [Chelonobacter oris]
MIMRSLSLFSVCLLSACSLVNYQPVKTIGQVKPEQGYRMLQQISRPSGSENFIILMLSGGGTRAAALGYGVLEQLAQTKIKGDDRGESLLDNIDMVYGVSGGSVLAAYFALYGKQTIPDFERKFLRLDFQNQIIKQVFSFSNLPRLTSPQFGRGDLLQEQLNQTLFKEATFSDLEKRRKGPFAVISATDMTIGQRLNFTQEFFDIMCLDLGNLQIARAVAASSAVPLVFAPLTLNNNGGNCHFQMPPDMRQAMEQESGAGMRDKTREEYKQMISDYQNSRERPFVHLIDGGLTDNLGLRSLLDMGDIYGQDLLYKKVTEGDIRNIVVINVNAQNQISSDIDKTADVPGIGDVVNAVINVPIDQYSLESLRRFRIFTDDWNEKLGKRNHDKRVTLHFVSLNLKDLPQSALRDEVLNISTSFYLPPKNVNQLKQAAKMLLQQSEEYRQALQVLAN